MTLKDLQKSKFIDIMFIIGLIIVAHVVGVSIGAKRLDNIYIQRWQIACTERTHHSEENCQKVYDYIFKGK